MHDLSTSIRPYLFHVSKVVPVDQQLACNLSISAQLPFVDLYAAAAAAAGS